ncbi:MAG: SDR family oxidoreductase [Planctomycetota bacterium]|nr:SDR family oxidoreductase [Planctomycetota bacterium]
MTRQVLVTGGTGGIGRAIADAFAVAGNQVLATGIETDLPTGHDNLEFAHLDLQQPDAIQQLAESLDQLDVLVNCAGIILRNKQEFSLAGFQQVVDINLTGTMRMCTACFPLLQQQGGCVLNIASMLSYFGSGHAPGYSSSKGGVVQLTRSLAIAWAPDQVRVNALAPGWIETELTRPLHEDPERSQQILQRTPLGRWGEPGDVADAAVFLCSPGARFITGAVLPVDGGYAIT